MAIYVDIADRLFDYTDEECATAAVADFQYSTGLTDEEIVALWNGKDDPRRDEIEKLIFDAVDANGSAKRAKEDVPFGISLLIESLSLSHTFK